MQCLVQEVSFDSVVVLWFAFLDLMFVLLFFQSFCTPALPIWGPGMPVTSGPYFVTGTFDIGYCTVCFHGYPCYFYVHGWPRGRDVRYESCL